MNIEKKQRLKDLVSLCWVRVDSKNRNRIVYKMTSVQEGAISTNGDDHINITNGM